MPKNGFLLPQGTCAESFRLKSLVLFKDRMVTNCLMKFGLTICCVPAAALGLLGYGFLCAGKSSLPVHGIFYHIGNVFARGKLDFILRAAVGGNLFHLAGK